MLIAQTFTLTLQTTFPFLQLELQGSAMRQPYYELGEEILAVRLNEDEEEEEVDPEDNEIDPDAEEEDEYDDDEDEEDDHDVVIEDDDESEDEDDEEDEDEEEPEDADSVNRLMVFSSLRPSLRSPAVRRR